MSDPRRTLGYRSGPDEVESPLWARILERQYLVGFSGGVVLEFAASLVVWRTAAFNFAGGATAVLCLVILSFIVAGAMAIAERTRGVGIGLLASLPVGALLFVAVCATRF
jgi:hypothetical protein